MRHFLGPTQAPHALTRSVAARSAVTQLVAIPSAAQRLAPTQLRALTGAVAIATIAVPADAHLLRTTPAAVEPIALLARLHAPHTQQHWTTPRSAGIKTAGTCLYARVPAEGPGFLPRNLPGPSLVRRPSSRIAHSNVSNARAAPCASSQRSPRERHLNHRQRLIDSKQVATLVTRTSNSRAFACAINPVYEFGGVARKSPKSGGFTSPLTINGTEAH